MSAKKKFFFSKMDTLLILFAYNFDFCFIMKHVL